MKLEVCGILKEDILNKLIENLDKSLDISINSKINKKINELISEKANRIIEEELQKKVDSFINSVYQPVTAWGEKIGKPTTVAEVIQNSFVNWWDQSVDKYGKPTNAYSGKQSRAEFFVKKIAEDVLNDAIKNDFNKIVKESVNQLKLAIAKTMTEIIDKNLK